MIELKRTLADLDSFRPTLFRVFPAYITHIRFPRYKNIANNARIDFPFPVTALVGSNGSGKTSVLNALYGAPNRYSTGDYWFSTEVDPIVEGDGSPNRFIYGHYNSQHKKIVETRKARVRKTRKGRLDPNYWEPTKEAPGDTMEIAGKTVQMLGRSSDRWNPVNREVLYINFRKELSAFDKYFYFGKAPAARPLKASIGARKAAKAISSRRITSKTDRVRHDSVALAKIIESEDTSLMSRGRRIAMENRLLSAAELEMVSEVLGRRYTEARWIRHRLFQGEDGLSIVFRTHHGRYSEAFAGSGEVAVTSCIVQVMATAKGTLVLLDEPEVSLHPGAQERLLGFLALMAKRKQLQIIFSTHSPHLIGQLPDDAIKSFYEASDGQFDIIPSTHPYAAFRRLGDVRGKGVHVIVEDRLAMHVVLQAIHLMSDEAARSLFHVDYFQGGCSSILNARIPVLMERDSENILVLLDGDQRKVRQIVDPDTLAKSEDHTLEKVLLDQVGASPKPLIDGGASAKVQEAVFRRHYLSWTRQHLDFIPTRCPEELVLRAAGLVSGTESEESKFYKDLLHSEATKIQGAEANSETTDTYGKFLLGTNRGNSVELIALKETLEGFLKRMVKS